MLELQQVGLTTPTWLYALSCTTVFSVLSRVTFKRIDKMTEADQSIKLNEEINWTNPQTFNNRTKLIELIRLGRKKRQLFDTGDIQADN